MISVHVQTEDFDLTTEVNRLRSNRRDIGAVVSFLGTVRDIHGDDTILTMELEHYPGMTEQVLQEIAEEACRRWEGMDLAVIHRVGKLEPTDQIVLVAAGSRHRGDAFRACEYVIDQLKTRAPFWKKEGTSKGTRWVAAKPDDEAASRKW